MSLIEQQLESFLNINVVQGVTRPLYFAVNEDKKKIFNSLTDAYILYSLFVGVHICLMAVHEQNS